MSPRNNDKQVAGTYVFGILIFVTLAAVILFGSGVNPQDKGQIVRVLCAAGAGLVASFICGKLVIQKGNLPGWSNVPITASGGFALFLIVYYGWGGADLGKGGSKAAGTETNAITHSVIHVRIVDEDKKPVPNAILSLRDFGVVKASLKGELDVPISAFASGRIQTADLMAEGFYNQSIQLDGGNFEVQTLTMSGKRIHIQARVVNEENKPRTWGDVRLIGASGEVNTKPITSVDGLVEFELPPGVKRESLKIDINFPGYEQQFVSVGTKDDLIIIKLVAKHMKLQITVVDQRTGRPIPGAQVTLLSHSTKLSNAGGKCDFDINLFKLYKVLVQVTKPGYLDSSLDIPSGQSTERIVELKSLTRP